MNPASNLVLHMLGDLQMSSGCSITQMHVLNKLDENTH